MEYHNTKVAANRVPDEQGFYDTYGDDSPGLVALKLIAAIPLSFVLYAGVVAVVACLAAYGSTEFPCATEPQHHLLHCTIAG
jgi:hypothetical protein